MARTSWIWRFAFFGFVAAALVLVLSLVADRRAGGATAGMLRAAACGHPPFYAGNWPPACFRFFKTTSPFNRPLPGDVPALEHHSHQAITHPVTQSRVGNFSEDPRGGGGEGVYYSRKTDPVFRLHCVHDEFNRPDHTCPIDGVRLRVPAGARPEANLAIVVGRPRKYDAHLIVIDQLEHWEYDLWQVQSTSSFQSVSGPAVKQGLKAAGGRIDFSWGGRIRLSGTGSSVDRPSGDPVDDANAAHWAETAGRIRAEELAAANITHALFLNTPCTANVPSVYPADRTGRAFPCPNATFWDFGSIPLGSRIWLDMRAPAINALPVPSWKKTILRALAKYGGFIGDTNGDRNWLFYIETEGGNMYSALRNASGHAYPDRWYQFAAANAWPVCTAVDCVPGVRVGKLYRDPPADNYDYSANIWPKLRVVDACVTPRPGQQPCVR